VTLGSQPPKVASSVPDAVGRAYVDRLAATECPAFTARRKRRAEASGAPNDPIVWREARGANVVDVEGNVFVDLTSGFGASSVGHAHPRVVEAIREQSSRLVQGLGDVYPSDVKVALLERLAAMMPFAGARALLATNGADAVEIGLQTARLATGRPGIVAFTGAYHGLSLGALDVCGYSPAFREPFASWLTDDVVFVPFAAREDERTASLTALEAALVSGNVGAVLIEPILGRGGVHVPPAGYLVDVASLARRHGALVVVDEIFVGLGRAGSHLRSVEEGVTPDIVCLGKALGGGMPISACLAREDVMRAWGEPGREAIRTGTFYGHPVSCAAALSALDVLEDEGLVARSHALGERALARLARHGDARGAGLFLGLDVGAPGRALGVVRRMLELGYLVLPAGNDASVVQLVPPLSIDEGLLEGAIDALGRVVRGEA
jgi:4-aminobutyrate aminotransferase/(S)-3-amino-2-methylpropionate transaminase